MTDYRWCTVCGEVIVENELTDHDEDCKFYPQGEPLYEG